MKKGSEKNLKPLTKTDLNKALDKAIGKAFDRFAIIMKRSFDDVHARLDRFIDGEFEPFKKETERSFYSLQSDVNDLKDNMRKVEARLTKVEDAVDAWKPLWGDHELRIVRLEEGVA